MAARHFGSALRRWLDSLSGQTTDDLSDEQLLQLFLQQRDEAAFDALMRRHGPLVLGVCRRLLRDTHDADDAFQATFLVLACRAASIRRRDSVASFLYGTACRIAGRLRKQKAQHHRLQRRVAVERCEASRIAEEDQETFAMLHEELNRLPQKYRDVLILCYLQGKSNEEAADELGYPLGSMSRHLSRARELLRERLLSRGIGGVAILSGAAMAEQAGAMVSPALLCGTLDTIRRHALASALLAGSTPPAAVLLAQSVLRAVWTTRLTAASLLLTVGLAFAGSMAMLQTPADKPSPVDAKAPATPVDAKPQQLPPRRDLYGNPLPDGALARMGTERLRHPYARGIAFADDGRTLISAGQDQAVRFWDCATGQLKRMQRVPRPQPVVALSPDGKTLALMDKDKEAVLVWDVTANKETQRIAADQLDFDIFLGAMVFSTDGKTLAAGSFGNGAYRIWDIGSGKERWRSQEKMGLIALSPNGKMFASCNLQGLALWDATSGKKLRAIPGPQGGGGLPSFSPDGKLLAVEDRSAIAFYETATGKEAAVWRLETPRHENIAYAGAFFSPDGKTVAIRYPDHVALWDRTTRQKEKKLHGPFAGTGDPHAQICFSPDGKQLACLRTGVIVLWDVATGKQIQERPSHFAAVDSVAFSPDGKLLASAASDDCTVRLWDASSGEQLHVWPIPHSGIGPLIFTPDGANVIVAGIFEGCRMWDVHSGKERCIFRLANVSKNEFERIAALHLSPDGRRLTALSLWAKDKGRKRQRYLTTWDAVSGKRVERRALAFDSWIHYEGDTFSADGKLVLTLDPRDASQRMIYDVVADRPLRKLPGFAPLAFSPDGKIIAADGALGGAPTPIQLIDAASGGNLLSLSAGDGWLRKFTPDGRYLVTGGNKDLRLWELATGKEVLHRRFTRIDYPSPSVIPLFLRRLAIAPDGRSAATGLGNSNVLVWDLAAETRQQRKLTAADIDRLWTDLADKDAARAYRAAGTLIADPERSVPLLDERLQPIKEDAPRIRQLAADLDSEQFPVRDAAWKELEKMDDAAHAVLRQELAKAKSLEQRRRIQTLLTVPWLVQAPEKLRQIRGVRVLEQIGDAAARRLLERLAGGAAEARQTREAKASLQRLKRQL